MAVASGAKAVLISYINNRKGKLKTIMKKVIVKECAYSLAQETALSSAVSVFESLLKKSKKWLKRKK